jgi:hypothetical protein
MLESSKEVNWKDIATNFVGRKDIDCMARWKEINPDNPNSIKCSDYLNQGRRSLGQRTKMFSLSNWLRSMDHRNGLSLLSICQVLFVW